MLVSKCSSSNNRSALVCHFQVETDNKKLLRLIFLLQHTADVDMTDVAEVYVYVFSLVVITSYGGGNLEDGEEVIENTRVL